MTTLLATADLHVSSTQALAGSRPIDPETGEPRVLVDARNTLDWICAQADEHAVDAVLVAGDIYESPTPGPGAEAVVNRAFAAIASKRPVAVLLGNHDRPNGSGAHALEPLKHLRPGVVTVIDTFQVHSLSEGMIRRIDPGAVLRSGLGRAPRALIFPVPYPSRGALAAMTGSGAETNAAMAEMLDGIIQAHAVVARELRTLWPGTTMVLFGHGTLRGAAFNDYQTVPLSDAPISTGHFETFDACVWGHLHKRQGAVGTCDTGKTTAFSHGYVGSPDRHSFGEEGDPKGVSIIEGATTRFIPNDLAREWHTVGPDGIAARELLDRSVIYRVKGEVTAEQYDDIAARVRQFKAAGIVFSNTCTVPREDRGRVDDLRLDRGVAGVLDGVFEARPDLAEHEAVIRRRVAAAAAGGIMREL